MSIANFYQRSFPHYALSVKLANTILKRLASEGKTVVSRWRCRYYLWLSGEPFADDARALTILRAMERMEWIASLDQGKGKLFYVTAPFAPAAVNPYELALEAYHGCTLAFATAMEVHQLTDQRATAIHLLRPPGIQGYSLSQLRKQSDPPAEPILLQQLPAGTSPEAWQMNEIPRQIGIKSAAGREIVLHSVRDRFVFDFVEAEGFGTAVRVASRERTLVEGLRFPADCGGLNEVFRAWSGARDELDLDRVIDAAERFRTGILFQRVGFVLETLGFEHPRLEDWKRLHVQRGGSRVLDPGAPFASEYSATWGLSINHPIDLLEG